MMECCVVMEEVTYQKKRRSLGAMRRRALGINKQFLLALLASTASTTLAQSCISLKGSKRCPAFNTSSISTGPGLGILYPFLAFVSSTEDFDNQLSRFVANDYVQQKYQNILGCDKVNLSNTTSLYARYTTSLICNGIVQNSRQPCGTAAADARPLCADSCAELAISEEKITTDTELCGRPADNYVDQIRADFTNCALPADSLSGTCVTGAQNEPDNCGFGSSLVGLCDYCRASSENATDSCCIGSEATHRCQGVVLPQFSVNPTLLPTSTSSAGPTASASNTAAHAGGSGLSKGAVAGIVIGSVVAAALLLGLLAACCFLLRRKGKARSASSSQPYSQRRAEQSMQQTQPMSFQNGYEVLPGGRVARMSALQAPSAGESVPQIGAVAGVGSRRGYDTSDSEAYGDSPEARDKIKGPGKRDGSLSSNSVFPVGQDSSPNSDSNGQYSSPEGVNSGQSEQLAAFKDYYSSDHIHPNDKVSVLWAYQPRAGDEFELERGDMLKVVGIWDDGWATGIRIDDRAEDYDGKHKVQRDSGVSNGSEARAQSPPPTGEIKAFPLVCVCLPEAWRKTVEGDASPDSDSVTRPAT